MAVKSMAAFLKKNAVQKTEVEAVISDRFQENGAPVPWRIRVLNQKEMGLMARRCSKRIIDAETKRERIETDNDAFIRCLIEECVVYPNLKDAALQDSYGAMGAAELAEIMLLPGEYAELVKIITQAQGIDSGMADKVKTVKN